MTGELNWLKPSLPRPRGRIDTGYMDLLVSELETMLANQAASLRDSLPATALQTLSLSARGGLERTTPVTVTLDNQWLTLNATSASGDHLRVVPDLASNALRPHSSGVYLVAVAFTLSFDPSSFDRELEWRIHNLDRDIEALARFEFVSRSVAGHTVQRTVAIPATGGDRYAVQVRSLNAFPGTTLRAFDFAALAAAQTAEREDLSGVTVEDRLRRMRA